MASKSGTQTPIQARIHRLMQASSGSTRRAVCLELPRSSSNPSRNQLRSARVLSAKKTPVQAKQEETEKFPKTSSTSRSSSNTPIHRFQPKSTTINACYTPSSLFKSTSSNATNSVYKFAVSTPQTSPRKFDVKSSNKNQEQIEEHSPRKRNRKCSSKDVEISNLTVAIRVRPLGEIENSNLSIKNIVQASGNQVNIYTPGPSDNNLAVTHKFCFELVFNSSNSKENFDYATQKDIFEGIGLPLLDKAFAGYNACLFAYGQTGSGKSYSMTGIEKIDEKCTFSPDSEAGIIPRFCYELFNRIDKSKGELQAEIEVSYFEIYNEKIHDLLCVPQYDMSNSGNGVIQRNPLKIREHPVWGPYVVGLSVHSVDSYKTLRKWLTVGNSQRATAATAMNDKSSRSHSIFNIILNSSQMEQCNGGNVSPNKALQVRRSKISLVDLAGSERISYTGLNNNCDRVREGVSINKSLLTLGKVIAALADSKKKETFVPYRDSVLTWLLRESLGGNSKTVMLATISPASNHIDETLATLRYACQARTIINRVTVNEDRQDRIIRELRAEVNRLKSLRLEYERSSRISSNHHILTSASKKKILDSSLCDENEVELLRQQLAETEKQLSRAQKTAPERVKEAELQRKSEQQVLQRKGLALELPRDKKQACLVNLASDPILSGILFYLLPSGTTVHIGRAITDTTNSNLPMPDIILDGPLVAPHHCSIKNVDGELYVSPEDDDFETYLNGEVIQETRRMYHGDRLVIGALHYFRVSNPFCTESNRNVVVDFQLAHQEILQKQEQELRRDLEKEKFDALQKIEEERNRNERDYQERIEMLELEKLKFICDQEILETEKEFLVDDNETNNDCDNKIYESQKSDLLDEIKKIIHNPSEESLHKTQIMVKEATQRCRELSVPFEFKQIQILDNFGIFRSVILILDKKNHKKAEWPIARLDVWLSLLRENEIEPENLFKCVDIEWEPYEQDLDEILNDSFKTSGRMSLNVGRKQLPPPPPAAVANAATQQISTPSSPPQKYPSVLTVNRANIELVSAFYNSENAVADNEETIEEIQQHFTSTTFFSNNRNARKQLTYDDSDNSSSNKSNNNIATVSSSDDFSTAASLYLHDIQRSALRLKKLYEKHNSNENDPKRMQRLAGMESIRKNMEHLETVLQGLRAALSECQAKKDSPKAQKCVRFKNLD